MDEHLKEQAEKKKREGWIHALMLIEVLAVTGEAARSAMQAHLAQLAKEKKTIMFRQDLREAVKVENPLPTVPVGYSVIGEVETVTENFETLLYLVMNYAPTATEILAPQDIGMDAGEAQSILNSVADIIHKFARQGLGGIVVKG